MEDLSPKMSDFIRAGFDPYGPASPTRRRLVSRLLAWAASWPAKIVLVLALFSGGAVAKDAGLLRWMGLSSWTLEGADEALYYAQNDESPSRRRTTFIALHRHFKAVNAVLAEDSLEEGALGKDAANWLRIRALDSIQKLEEASLEQGETGELARSFLDLIKKETAKD